MFTLIATKLPHYLLPVWPALALAVGGTLAAGQEENLAERDLLWLRRGAWLLAPVAAAWSWWRSPGIFPKTSAGDPNCARLRTNKRAEIYR